LEGKVRLQDLPHPSNQTSVEYELLEDMTSDTQKHVSIEGPQTYTDDSKLDAKVGVALIWWENGREECHGIFSLVPTCTVFQSELYALQYGSA
jgi:hypothetical protein